MVDTQKYNNVMEIIKGRRTIRKFSLTEKVSRKTIDVLLNAGRWAPSACNRQRWEFIVIDDRQQIRELETRIKLRPLVGNYVYVLVMYDSTKELKESNLADVQSAAMAVQNVLLVAYTLGIGVKLIGGLGDLNILRAIVNAPSGLRPIVLMAIGYADEMPDPPQRRPLSEMIHYGKFGGRLQPNARDPEKWKIEEIAEFQSTIIRYGASLNKRPEAAEKGLQSSFHKLNLSFSGKKRLFVLPYSGSLESGLVREQDIVYCFSVEIAKHFHYVVGSGNYICGDGYSIPLDDASVDDVFWLDTIGHLPMPESLLREIYRVMKFDGNLLLLFSNRNSLFGLAYDLYNFKLRDSILNSYLWRIGPERKFCVRNVRQLIHKCGLEIDSEYGISVGNWKKYPLKWRSVVRVQSVFERLSPVIFSDLVAMSVRKLHQF